jgi:hypothetical protein
MRIRIVHQADGNINGISLKSYRQGHVYDVVSGLAEYLVAEGIGIIEMRRGEALDATPRERRQSAHRRRQRRH